ncbi:IclR family transcriptional regulator [Methylobrevis albus]|uniref:IclR family transcriptional regulator n=1 Tax=Methylobrevis albus TaxID=2793297 RepID=A0A931I390_9HYPH|nr:IclR family transcriptional regulator [Methylobrevis albus]MBH0238078.1 IclR family transcriptional regulator [Methylobrevis albus]
MSVNAKDGASIGLGPDTAAEDGAAPEADRIGPLGRALALLDVFAAAGRPLRFADVHRASPLPKATLHRLLHQLEAEGMLMREPGGQHWRLGLRLIRLAHAAWEGASLVEAARPVLDRLAAELGATIHLAALDGSDVLYLDKRHAGPSLRLFSRPGRVGPAYCTGVGKAMLAALPAPARAAAVARQRFERHTPHTITSQGRLDQELAQIAARGHAVDDEEHEAGVVCVAAPIVGARGTLLGALSVTTTTRLLPLAELERHAPTLRSAAAEIARAADMQLIGS